jgi:hypothetical protein
MVMPPLAFQVFGITTQGNEDPMDANDSTLNLSCGGG